MTTQNPPAADQISPQQPVTTSESGAPEVVPTPTPDPPATTQAPVPLPPLGAVGPRPTRTFRLRALLLVAAISALLAGGIGYLIAHTGHSGGGAQQTAAKEMWQCPMHPTIIQDHPGECPICGMKLVKVGAGATSAAAASGERKIKFYRSPMDPRQTSPVPRKDEMGMDYIPVYEDETSASASMVEGLATVDIDPARQQLIGLKTVEVTRGKVSGAWQTVGRVAVDERRVRHVSIKVPVYVEHVYVDFVGKKVKKGAPLFSGYSPEVYAAQQEYKIALGSQQPLAEAARRKLELWDIPQGTIKSLEHGGKPKRSITFYSPIAGVVTKKDVVDGMKLEEGAMPYEITDLSRVWVLADVYESDLHRVRVGMPAKLTLKAYPSRVFEGSSVFVDPVLDPRTRTAKLRLEFPNKENDLRPEMFGDVVLESAEREGVRIPEDAVIDSGTKKVVFVAIGAGKFQPREVKLGDSDRANVEVLSGLSPGERVVVRANFLVDSESRLRASLSALASPTEQSSAAPGASQPAATPGEAKPSGNESPPSGHSRAGDSKSAPAAKPKPDAKQPAASASAPAALPYACPMHPEVRDTKPSRCPKCGMTLTPGGK